MLALQARAGNAAAAEATIHKYWNQSFPDGYSVTCDVTVTAGTGSASDAARGRGPRLDRPPGRRQARTT